jgi:hypothetical protein
VTNGRDPQAAAAAAAAAAQPPPAGAPAQSPGAAMHPSSPAAGGGDSLYEENNPSSAASSRWAPPPLPPLRWDDPDRRCVFCAYLSVFVWKSQLVADTRDSQTHDTYTQTQTVRTGTVSAAGCLRV